MKSLKGKSFDELFFLFWDALEQKHRILPTKLFFILILFSFCHSANGQSDYSISGKSIAELQERPLLSFKPGPAPIVFFQSKSITQKQTLPELSQHFLTPYSVDNLAFFCRLEVKLEKKIGLPFKFRLGEVQYTEKMEGKY